MLGSRRPGIMLGPFTTNVYIVGASRVNAAILTTDGSNNASAIISWVNPVNGQHLFKLRAPAAGPSAIFDPDNSVAAFGDISVAPSGTGAEVYVEVNDYTSIEVGGKAVARLQARVTI